MTFYKSESKKRGGITPVGPNKVYYSLSENRLGNLWVHISNVPDIIQSLRHLMKACAWADGLDLQDLHDANRASVLAISLIESTKSTDDDPHFSWLSLEDVKLLLSIAIDPKIRYLLPALNHLSKTVRESGVSSPVEGDKLAKSTVDLFTC